MGGTSADVARCRVVAGSVRLVLCGCPLWGVFVWGWVGRAVVMGMSGSGTLLGPEGTGAALVGGGVSSRGPAFGVLPAVCG